MNIEFFSSTMNDDRIYFRIIMLTLISNNFHWWIEELKDLSLKIKIEKYINSYNQTAKSREEVLCEISHYDIRASAFTFSAVLTILLQIKLISLRKLCNLVSRDVFMNCRLSNKKIIEQMWKNTNEKKSKSSKWFKECSR